MTGGLCPKEKERDPVLRGLRQERPGERAGGGEEPGLSFCSGCGCHHSRWKRRAGRRRAELEPGRKAGLEGMGARQQAAGSRCVQCGEDEAGKAAERSCGRVRGVILTRWPEKGHVLPPGKKKALGGILAKCTQGLRPSQPERGPEEAEPGQPADRDARPNSPPEGHGARQLPAR